MISGAFSLTRQAIQLGYLPRMEIIHTSSAEIGQIYMPTVNWALMVATIALVIGFGSSSNIAGAYGVAVSTTMLITTILAYVVARELRGWSRARARASSRSRFLVGDLAFLVANYAKIAAGGWFPLLVARDRLHDHDDVAARPGDPLRETARRSALAGAVHPVAAHAPADPRARHRRVHASQPATPSPRRCCTASSTTRRCISR